METCYRIELLDAFGQLITETRHWAVDAGGGVDVFTPLFQRWSSNRNTMQAHVPVQTSDDRCPYQLVITKEAA